MDTSTGSARVFADFFSWKIQICLIREILCEVIGRMFLEKHAAQAPGVGDGGLSNFL